MSFHAGLAASPDLSNDVEINHNEERAAHEQLLHEAYSQVQSLNEARHYTDTEDESQQIYGSFDFSRKDLESLPAELVDVIGQHADRLALGWNKLTGLSTLGPRLAEFTNLRYLVMRNNLLEDFPQPILSCTSLEVLDLHANHIHTLPDDFSKLKNLKKFAIDRNRVTRIPTCIAHMGSLHWIDARNNPIEFPDKNFWKLNNRTSDDGTRGPNWDRLTDETKRLKRALLQHAKSGRSPESDLSESTTDTPKPVRKRTGGGRFPIRPSVSGVDLDSAGNASNSPTPARPALKSSKTMHLTQTTRNTSVRPSVEPLISKDRHRSNSESQMSTNRRQKRMGIHMSRGGSGNSSAEISLDGVDLNKEPRSTHARGTSAGSLLNQVLQGHGVTDSSGPESPVTTDLSRSASQYAGHGRLSSLPENKRKSQYSEPFVELADTIVFSMTQVEAPLKRMVTAAKSSGSRRRSLERSYHSAFACKGDLSEALYNLETFDEEDGGKRKSVLSVREQCEMCIRNYQKLLDALQSHVNSVVDNTRPRELRMMMHITFGVMLEVKSLTSKINDVVTIRQESRECKPAVQVSKPERLEGRLQERTVEVPARQASNSPRPKTSLRIKDRGRIAAHHHHQSSNVNKPLPTPRSARSTSGASQLSRRPSYASSNTRPQDAYNLPTPSLTHSNSFLSTASTDAMDEYEEDQLFEDIFTKLNDACNKSLQGLPMCKKIFTLLRKGPREATNHIHGAEQVYDRFLQHCDYALEACNELKKRLKTLKVREPQARDHIEFWQVCTAFTKAYFVFATTLRDSHYPGLVPDQVRTLLRPVQKGVKEASNLIDNSPWCHLAVHGPNSAGPSPAVSGVLPFSMTNPTPPVVAPPAKDLPPRPNNPYAYTNGLGLQTSWGSSTTLTRSDTLGSNHSATGAYEGGTLRAMPTPHQTYVNGMSTPGELSRSHSRAGRPPPPPAPTSNPSFNSSFGSNGSFGSSHYAEPPPMDNRAHDSRFAPVADPRYTSSEPRYTPVDGPLSGTRSGYSSGYGTPLPVTPMSAALGPAAKATANSENEGTIRRAGGGVHEKQNSWESVNGHSNGGGQGWYNGNSNGSTTGYGHGATHAYSNGVSPHNGLNGAGGSTTSLVNISASLRSGLGGPGGVERIERPERPDILPRSVSAAGYYPSSVPARMGSRNVSRSASQRR